MDETTTVSHKGNKLRPFTLEFKLNGINYAKTHSNQAATKKFNVDERRIREWKQKHEKNAITQTKKGGVSKKRLPGGGRKHTDKELEEKVLNWIHEHRENMFESFKETYHEKSKNFI